MSIVSQNSILNQYVPVFYIRSIVDGQILMYDSTRRAFINVDPNIATSSINKLGELIDVNEDVDNPLAQQNGQALVFDSFTSLWTNKFIDYNTLLNKPTISLTGDITGTGTTSLATTLATVNSNVGTFGSSTVIPVITVNAKGLITAVTTASAAGGSSASSFIASTSFSQVPFNDLSTNLSISTTVRSANFAQISGNRVALNTANNYFKVTIQVSMYNSDFSDQLTTWPYNVSLYGSFLQEATNIQKSQHRAFAGSSFMDTNDILNGSLGTDIAQRVSFTDSYIVLTDGDTTELSPFILNIGVYAGSYSSGGMRLKGDMIITVEDLGSSV